MTGLAEEVRDQVRLALRIANVSQAELGRRLGLSPKHLSQMLTGKSAISLDMAEKMLAAVGWELDVFSRPRMQVIRTADGARPRRELPAGVMVQCTAHGAPVAMVRVSGLWQCPLWVPDGELRGHVRWISDNDVTEIAGGGRGRYRGVLVTLPDAPGSAVPAQE